MKIQWEYSLVEKPFCEQLKVMGWQYRGSVRCAHVCSWVLNRGAKGAHSPVDYF